MWQWRLPTTCDLISHYISSQDFIRKQLTVQINELAIRANSNLKSYEKDAKNAIFKRNDS